MRKRNLVLFKRLRVVSQAVFLSVFVYTFIRSLDPFSVVQNPFLRFDPLIFLTNPRPDFFLIAPIAGLIALTLVFGRFFCGWVCPMGSLMELSDFIFSFPRKANPAAIHASPHSFLVRFPPALVVLGAVVVSVFTTTSLLPFFHPNVWIVRILSHSVLGLVFLGLVFLSSLFGRRLWCVYLCPLGALYGVLSRVSFFRLRIERCSRCGACDRCPMQAADFRTREILPHQCILCFHFEKSCPVEGFRYGPVARAGMSTLRAPRRAGGASFDPSRREFLVRGAGLLGGAMIGGVLASLGGFSTRRGETRSSSVLARLNRRARRHSAGRRGSGRSRFPPPLHSLPALRAVLPEWDNRGHGSGGGIHEPVYPASAFRQERLRLPLPGLPARMPKPGHTAADPGPKTAYADRARCHRPEEMRGLHGQEAVSGLPGGMPDSGKGHRVRKRGADDARFRSIRAPIPLGGDRALHRVRDLSGRLSR